MNENIYASGIVLGAVPIGEYDKRLLLLTGRLGKISVFARGARRPHSPLMGSSVLFACGEFELTEGRTAYTLQSARIAGHFDYLAADLEAMCYASYFAEIADYYGREGVDASEAVKLLYSALRALKNDKLDRRLIRRVYELKTLQEAGECPERPAADLGESAERAWKYVMENPPEMLFRFSLGEEAFRRFSAAAEQLRSRCMEKSFRSLGILEELRLLTPPVPDDKKSGAF